MTSAIPMCGAISAAPETGTISTSRSRAREESSRHARKARGDAGVPRNCRRAMNAAVLGCGDDEAAAAEAEIRERCRSVTTGLGHEIESGDPGVRGTVGDEFRNVLGANEDRLECRRATR